MIAAVGGSAGVPSAAEGTGGKRGRLPDRWEESGTAPRMTAQGRVRAPQTARNSVIPPRPTHAPPTAAVPNRKDPVVRRRWSRLCLAAAGLGGLAGVDVAAGEPARRPLVAPRPAPRVTIARPSLRLVGGELAGTDSPLGEFFEPPRDPSAKPEVTDGPALLNSPTGRTGPVRGAAPVGKPRGGDEPARLSDAAGRSGVTAVRRITLVPPARRATAGPAGRVAVAAPRVDDGGRAFAGGEEDEADGPSLPDSRAVSDDLAAPDEVPGGDPAAYVGKGVPADPRVLDDPADDEGLEVAAEPAPEPPDPLAVACDEAIRVTAARLLTGESRTARSNSPWQIGHGLMALRGDYTLIADGRRVRALDWLATGPTFKGDPWFVRGPYGPKAHPYNKVMYDFEGHPNQILAFLAMSDLPTEFPLKDGTGRPFTIADWIETAQREVRLNPREEVTWTLWAFSVYLDSDAEWLNARRERWSMSRLVQEELKSNPIDHACGGTHGLYALASARNARLQDGRRLRGQWLLAHEKVSRYAALARRLQNPDGSLSDNYFRGRRHQRDLVTRIGSGGHTLEFLMMALPQGELRAAWVRAAVGRVATDLLAGREAAVGGKAVGGMYHAVHALKLYRERTGEDFAPVPLQTAERPGRRVIR